MAYWILLLHMLLFSWHGFKGSTMVSASGPMQDESHRSGKGRDGTDFLRHVHLYMATTLLSSKDTLHDRMSYALLRAIPQATLTGQHWPHMTFIAGTPGWNYVRSGGGDLACSVRAEHVKFNMTILDCAGSRHPFVVAPCEDTKWGGTGPCCKTDYAFRHFASLPLEARMDMRFIVFSDDDTYHDPTAFSALLSLFNPNMAYFIPPGGRANPALDTSLIGAMNLVTPICHNRGTCIGVANNCHGLRAKAYQQQGLDISLPYGGKANTTLVCGDDSCEKCMAFVHSRTSSLSASTLGCAHTHFRYSGMQQPLIISAGALDRVLPTFLGSEGLVAQCQALGITHDNALGILFWKLQIPSVSHYSQCSRLWYDMPFKKGDSADLLYVQARDPEQMKAAHAMYASRYNLTEGGSSIAGMAMWHSFRHKIRQCFAANHHQPAFKEGGFHQRGGVQLSRYWDRTTAEEREAGAPFLFEDCADYPSDANSHEAMSTTWLARPPNPLLAHHRSESGPRHAHERLPDP